MSYIEQQNMLQKEESPSKHFLLDLIRSISNWMNGTIFTWFPVFMALVFMILRKVLCTKPEQPIIVKNDNEWYQPVPSKDKDN